MRVNLLGSPINNEWESQLICENVILYNAYFDTTFKTAFYL